MLSFLSALSRRFHQPTGLAVTVTPLALLVCCVLAVQAVGSAEQPGIQTQAIAQLGDCRTSDFSAGQLQAVNATGVIADKAACCVPKAAWPVGKLQLARRIAERWAPCLFVSFAASSFEPSLVAGPTMPKVFDASSPEYLILRRLRL
jgi:hypothetical protein